MKENLQDSEVKEFLKKEIEKIEAPLDVKEEIWLKIASRNNRSKSLKIVPFIAACACILLILPLGLSINTFNENTSSKLSSEEKKDLETMEAVININLTGPDEEWKSIMEDNHFSGLSEYEEKLYRKYFASDSAYKEYISYFASSLLVEALRKNYQLKVISIEYEDTNSEEIIYNFSAEIEFQKESSNTTITGIVRGQANLNEKHKIEKMTINTADLMNYLSD